MFIKLSATVTGLKDWILYTGLSCPCTAKKNAASLCSTARLCIAKLTRSLIQYCWHTVVVPMVSILEALYSVFLVLMLYCEFVTYMKYRHCSAPLVNNSSCWTYSIAWSHVQWFKAKHRMHAQDEGVQHVLHISYFMAFSDNKQLTQL